MPSTVNEKTVVKSTPPMRQLPLHDRIAKWIGMAVGALSVAALVILMARIPFSENPFGPRSVPVAASGQRAESREPHSAPRPPPTASPAPAHAHGPAPVRTPGIRPAAYAVPHPAPAPKISAAARKTVPVVSPSPTPTATPSPTPTPTTPAPTPTPAPVITGAPPTPAPPTPTPTPAPTQAGAIALLASVTTAPVAAPARTAPASHPVQRDAYQSTSAQYDAGIAAAIHSDVGVSVVLPSGTDVYMSGDVTQVGGISVTGPYGYPHGAFSVHVPGSTSWAVMQGAYGTSYGTGEKYQQVPNWAGGDYFWGSNLIVDNGMLWVFGQRISGSAGTIVSDEAAEFSLGGPDGGPGPFVSITAIPGTDQWGSPVWASDGSGFSMIGAHGVSCTGAVDCKVGDVAWVPAGDEANESQWSMTLGALPATLNAGTAVSPIATASGYAAFTKEGDKGGTDKIEELTAPSMTGPWTVSQTFPAPVPAGCVSYSAQTHAEEPDSAGSIWVSYAVNGKAPCSQYSLDFVSVSL